MFLKRPHQSANKRKIGSSAGERKYYILSFMYEPWHADNKGQQVKDNELYNRNRVVIFHTVFVCIVHVV